MKYLVNFSYTLDEDTTFRYDKDCNKFMSIVADFGAIFNVVSTPDGSGGPGEPLLVLLKIQIYDLLSKFSTLYLGSTVLQPTSFNVVVTELHGINDTASAIIVKEYEIGNNTQVYDGPLTALQ